MKKFWNSEAEAWSVMLFAIGMLLICYYFMICQPELARTAKQESLRLEAQRYVAENLRGQSRPFDRLRYGAYTVRHIFDSNRGLAITDQHTPTADITLLVSGLPENMRASGFHWSNARH